MSGGTRVCIFVPAYNVIGQLEETIARISTSVWPKVHHCWLIDDGSSDGTANLAARIARGNPKIETVRFEYNRGYGAVVREGLARSRAAGAEIAVCLHGDGQYPPEVIPEFLRVMEEERYDLLQGSRIASGTALEGGMPLYKYAAGKVLTFLENRVFGLRMTDYHSGFLFYGRRALLNVPFERLSGSFDFDLEVLAYACAQGMRLGERPIPTRYADEISHLNPLGYGLRVVGIMLKYAMGRYRGI